MKAPKRPQPKTSVPRRPDRQPAGISQLRVDQSRRQDAQREYLGRLQSGARDDGLPTQTRYETEPPIQQFMTEKNPVQCVRRDGTRKARQGAVKSRQGAVKSNIKKPARGQLRAKYGMGTHGAKKSEQNRLRAKFRVPVSGHTHESEHTIGYQPLAQTTNTKRGKGPRARSLENHAPAYQEVKPFHRGHIGTGSSGTADGSGMNSTQYRDTQRALVEHGQVGNAVQINQLGYAFLPNFQNPKASSAQQAADDSFDTMVQNTTSLTYGAGDEDKAVDVSPEERTEMFLGRRAAQSGLYPTREEENEARKRFGLPLLPDKTSSDDRM